jgi:hypothetical protein
MSAPSEWTTPEALRSQVRRAWETGRILAASLTGEPLFPLSLRLRRPDNAALASCFDEVRRWIRTLEEGSRDTTGHGYTLEWTEVHHRQLGHNRVPCAAVVPTQADALWLVGKSRETERFGELSAATLRVFPGLREWVVKHPLRLLEHADDWDRVLAVLAWFRTHPRPGLYLRQLDIPGVDTKFIERRTGLLSELLERVLPAEAMDASLPRSDFERRLGLRTRPTRVHFRLLDRRLHVHGLSDLSVTTDEFAALRLPVERVFITENEVNGFAFPDVPQSLVIFGLGYSLERLGEVSWLASTHLYYWGDIDTHGFAMLDRLRAAFPHARSMLMDPETLLEHEPLWVEEREQHPGVLVRLNEVESALFRDLQQGRFGPRVRLEQERIRYGWLEQALAESSTQ